ncbi:MAG: Rab family GTPase [Candidatus Heimdallarchaeota archaeon]
MITFKIVVIGDSGVGKTSLTMRYADQTFQYEYIKTIGTNFFMKTIPLLEEKVDLVLWDLAGDEAFGLLRPTFYQGAFGALLVCDVTRHSSFEHLEEWLKELRNNIPHKIPIVLSGNKIDLKKDEWEVNESEIQAFAETRGIPYFLTSAKANINVSQVFLQLAKDIGTSLPDFSSSNK